MKVEASFKWFWRYMLGTSFGNLPNEEGIFLLELILVSCLCSSVDTWREMHLERWVSLVLSHTQNRRSKILSPWWIGKSPKHPQKIKNGENTWKMQPTNLEHKNDNASFFGWWGSCSGQWTKTGFPSSLVNTFRWGKMGVNMCKYIYIYYM